MKSMRWDRRPRQRAAARALAGDGSNANFSDMAVYRAASGATVFATGSIGWSQTVPQVRESPATCLRGSRPAPCEHGSVAASIPVPFEARDIGNVGRPGCGGRSRQLRALNGAGQDRFQGSDVLLLRLPAALGRRGDHGAADVLQLYWGNRAGIMIHDSLSPTAKYVSLSAGRVKAGAPSSKGSISGSKTWPAAAREKWRCTT